jgi:hypothetical protein
MINPSIHPADPRARPTIKRNGAKNEISSAQTSKNRPIPEKPNKLTATAIASEWIFAFASTTLELMKPP